MKYFFQIALIAWLPTFVNCQSVFDEHLEVEKKPWTTKGFKNDPKAFQFAIVTDRTGGHRPGIFGKAVEKLNLLQPEFVLCVGDLIEGYTKNSTEVNRQWDEFNTILSDLQMRFFYLPGNHDISNSMMRNQWMERYGRAYYHFKYQDVLFLAFDTNDGDSVMLSPEQIDYFKQVLQDNQDVRWTMVFMHHPIWNYREFNGFTAIEDLLKDRPYTVYAGHNHRYHQTQRQERNYYILATTGGGSRLHGPKFGQYDHITWITMTPEGPKMVNMQLEGLLEHDISNDQTIPMARNLMQASNFQYLVLSENPESSQFSKGAVYLNVKNSATTPLYLKGHLYHHHQLMSNKSQIDLMIEPQSNLQFALNLEAIRQPIDTQQIDPLQLDWVMGYPTEKLDTPFELSGTAIIPIEFTPQHLNWTPIDVFLETQQVSIQHPFKDLVLKYTLDGSDPTLKSESYERPITINATSEVKVRFFSKDGSMKSHVFSKTYRQVEPLAAIRNSAGKNPGLNYKYYEGNFSTLPDFSTLTAKQSGVTQNFDVESLALRQDHYAIEFTGYIDVPITGIYTFYTYSDDGSKLFLHDQLIVNNDGSHSARLKMGYVALEKGKHPIRIAYFEDFLGETLRVGYDHPELKERQEISFEQLFHDM